MNTTHNKKLTSNSQRLRREMTKEERHLWYDFLKQQPVTINRQKVIGNYIADFYCAKAKIVIELDGSQHYETEGIKADSVRDAYFQSIGIRVLRYSNHDINHNFSGVCEDILRNIKLSPWAKITSAAGGGCSERFLAQRSASARPHQGRASEPGTARGTMAACFAAF